MRPRPGPRLRLSLAATSLAAVVVVATTTTTAATGASPSRDGAQAPAGVWVRAGEARARVLGLAWNGPAVVGRFDRQVPEDAGFVSLIVPVRARGFWALPEVGDEVTISFLEGDPDRPLVLGLSGTRWGRPESQLPPQSGNRRVRIAFKAARRGES